MLEARLDDYTTLTVSPIDEESYAEFVGDDTLGGCHGYFLLKSSRTNLGFVCEVLAKAPSFEAAQTVFDMIVRGHRLAVA